MTFTSCIALAATLAVTSAGCGTTATITKKDASRYEVEIVRSTPSELIVATRDGERPIPRDQIRDIDHPGNVAAFAGAALLLAGSANLLGFHRCQGRDSSGFCVGWAGGDALVGSGLGMIAWGAITWTRSVEAAGGQPVAPVARLAPALFGTPARPYPGATLALSF